MQAHSCQWFTHRKLYILIDYTVNHDPFGQVIFLTTQWNLKMLSLKIQLNHVAYVFQLTYPVP